AALGRRRLRAAPRCRRNRPDTRCRVSGRCLMTNREALRAPFHTHVIAVRRADPTSPPPSRSRFLARAALSALGCVASVAPAQDAPDNTLQRVEITGTRITQIDAETALPVVVIKREQIDRTGATTAEELLTRLSASVNTGKEVGSFVFAESPGY